MLHTSYAFPSHWVVLLEAALALTAAALLATGWGRDGASAAWRRLRRLSARPAGTGAALALGVVALLGLHAAVAGMPVPAVNDEFGHLLVADTLAHGRLASAPPPLARHFEAAHVLLEPGYTAKYWPAQGLVMAIGQRLGGHPAGGVWLGAGLLAAATLWGLAAALPPPWPLVGALLVALRLALGSHWGHSYWGGAVPAAAALLAFGAAVRLSRRWRPVDGATLGLAATLLANSRPYEALALAVPLAAIVLRALARARRGPPPGGRRPGAALAALGVTLAAGAAMTLAYHWRVTGELFTTAYRHYDRTHAMERILALPADAAGATQWLRRCGWVLASSTWALLGLPLGLAAAGAAGHRRTPAVAAAAATVGLGVPLMASNSWWFSHYAAPLLPAFLLLGLAGVRAAAMAPRRRARLGPRLPLLLLAVQLAVTAFQLPAWRPDAGDWSLRRQQLLASLEARGGRHLVFVDPTVRAGAEWLYNPADWEAAPVLLAADLGPASNAELAAALRDRAVWSLVPRPSPTRPSLRPGMPDASGAAPRPR